MEAGNFSYTLSAFFITVIRFRPGEGRFFYLDDTLYLFGPSTDPTNYESIHLRKDQF